MRIKTLSADYQVTRSRDFQSVRVGGAVEIEIGEDEKPGEAFTKAQSWLARLCNDAAQDQLEAVLYGPKGGAL